MNDGYFAVIIDEEAGKEPYQGITPLIGNSLSECAESFSSVRATSYSV